MLITSKDNSKIKEIKKLKEKKYRKTAFIVEGIKMLKEAISEKAEIDTIIIREDTELDFKLDSELEKKVIHVTKNVFETISDVVSPQGVLVVINKKIDDNKISKHADYILALDGIQDPGNLGTIIRTADSANIKQILVSKDTVDSYSPKVVRSTMGAIYRVKIIECEDLAKTLKSLQTTGFEIVTTDLHTDKSIYDMNYNKKIVVIGNEANGVTPEIRELSNYRVKIPMLGKTESLNAAVATGIMIYEYVRQKIQ
ncbi:rRNA methylase putative group 3 [Clostridium sp. CAG:793]|nr:rRNA methylase putative group 3 [Clostridium sp. CAG:793]